jgi:PAS domain S-box-containing protein
MSEKESTQVLIVEDNSLIGEIIKGLLEEMGYTVVGEAADGFEAVGMTQSTRPDVVLMDIRMPIMDGIEATRLIQERCPTPVVVLTAYDTPELVERASAAGAGAYLVKPPNAREIEHAITIATARFGDMMELRRLNAELQAEIAERKRAEEALWRREQEIRMIADNVPALVSYVDADGCYRFVNKRYEEWFGVPRTEIIGKHYRQVLGEVTYELIKDRVEAALSGHRTSYEEALPYARGGTRWVIADYVPDADDQGQVKGFFVLVTDITERKRVEEEVAKHRKDLQSLSTQLINAQEAERKRISQELHDEMGQALTAMSINLAAIKKELSPELAPAIRERLAETSSLADRTLDQVRELSLDLRPSMLDDLGLVPTLRWYVNRYAKRLNLEVEFEAVDLEERLPAEMETVLYRAVQEALTNAARHAQASRVRIRLERKKSTVAAFIEDDGQGFDIEQVAGHGISERGVGLFGMRERVASLGGRLRIQSRPGRGTRLMLEIPL